MQAKGNKKFVGLQENIESISLIGNSHNLKLDVSKSILVPWTLGFNFSIIIILQAFKLVNAESGSLLFKSVLYLKTIRILKLYINLKLQQIARQ